MAYPSPSYSALAPGLSTLTCSHISRKPHSRDTRSALAMISLATPTRRASGHTATLARYARCGLDVGNGGGRGASGTHTCSVALPTISRVPGAGGSYPFGMDTNPVATPPGTTASAMSCVHCLDRERLR